MHMRIAIEPLRLSHDRLVFHPVHNNTRLVSSPCPRHSTPVGNNGYITSEVTQPSSSSNIVTHLPPGPLSRTPSKHNTPTPQKQLCENPSTTTVTMNHLLSPRNSTPNPNPRL
ncbi:hypothetical protein BDV24DRAFT_134662 [Aspergillus arachidicola]|uniref:Uncharacterized protein n=1 Tax=Aspergillus arachidicola TaxID=656916 RepID=A0A5N6Y5G9_9EURO|nr:hypothetical protein BDV24DRAFT_134662 [Aspergillus arachidicola]